jgi:hypothetical protein
MYPHARGAGSLVVLTLGLFTVLFLLAREPAIPGPPPAATSAFSR